MNEEKFMDIDNVTPDKGQYCEIKVVSYFRGWYLPQCESWSWLMDDGILPTSHVEAWKESDEKGDRNEFI